MAPAATPKGQTTRRKSQNVVAQRIYRAKQRDKVKNLERLAALAVAGQDAHSSICTARDSLLRQVKASRKDLVKLPESAELTSSDVYALMEGLGTAADRDKCLDIIERECLGLRDIIKYGLIITGNYIDPTVFELAASLPLRAWLGMVKAGISGAVDVKVVFAAGIRFLVNLKGPNSSPLSSFGRKTLSLPQLTQATFRPQSFSSHLTLAQMSYAAAIKANAEHLRIPLDDLLSDTSLSPFSISQSFDLEGGGNSSTANSNLTVETDGARHQPADLAGIKPDLRPTTSQLNIPHHPCFDIFPWPVFRTKAIIACYMDPPMIDEDDLCLDVMNDAFRCWGSTVTSTHGRGQGAPWDSRSWEVAPWFLEKWSILTDGPDGDMWRNSAWWRSMRLR